MVETPSVELAWQLHKVFARANKKSVEKEILMIFQGNLNISPQNWNNALGPPPQNTLDLPAPARDPNFSTSRRSHRDYVVGRFQEMSVEKCIFWACGTKPSLTKTHMLWTNENTSVFITTQAKRVFRSRNLDVSWLISRWKSPMFFTSIMVMLKSSKQALTFQLHMRLPLCCGCTYSTYVSVDFSAQSRKCTLLWVWSSPS